MRRMQSRGLRGLILVMIAAFVMVALPWSGSASAIPLDGPAVANGSITGTVTKSSGGAAAGVTVIADGYYGSFASTTTAADGIYTIANVPPGTVRLQFVPSAGSHLLGEFYNDAKDYYSATPIVVVSGANTPNINATLQVAATITGKVTDAANQPVTTASVSAYLGVDPNSSTYAYSGLDGTYSIDVPPGAVKLQFQSGTSTLANEWWNDAFSRDEATSITTVAGSTVANINPVLDTAGTISGRITRVDGTPVSYYGNIQLWHNGHLVTSTYTTYGGIPDGIYSVSAKPGTYKLYMTTYSGGTVIPEWYNNAATEATATAVVVTGGVATPNINVALSSPGKVVGTVTRAGGTPVQGVSVSATSTTGGSGASGTTDAAGHFTLTGITAGSYRVQYTPPSGSGLLAEYYSNSLSAASASPVVVANDATTTADALLDVGGTIAGTVTRPNGSPVVGASVSVSSTICCGSQSPVVTDAAGHYSVSGLAPGSYRVQFTPPSGSDLVGEYFNNSRDYATSTLVTAALAATTTADAKLEVGAKITGKVTGPGGGAVPGVSINASTTQGASATAISDAAGNYTILGLGAGTYAVRFTPPNGSTLMAEYYNDTISSVLATNVTLSLGGTRAAVDAHLTLGAVVSGTITSGGAVVAGATVSIDAASATTDAAGQYSIPGLDPGPHSVYFRGPSGSTMVPEYYNNASSYVAATALVLSLGQVLTGIDADLAAGGNISGTVTQTGGAPLANASVLVDSTYGGSTSTSASGTYTVTGLSPGYHRVCFRAAYGVLLAPRCYGTTTFDMNQATPIAVTAGSTTPNINAVLASGGSISGTVTANGVPVAGAYVSGYSSGFSSNWVATDAAGHYVIAGLPAGAYQVSFSASGYLYQYYPDALDFATEVRVAVGSGAVTGIDAHLTAGTSSSYASVSGVVTGPGGTPVPGATVFVQSATGGGYSTATDGAGAYLVTYLSAGSYKVLATAPTGVNLAPTYLGDTGDAAHATTLAVTAGGASTGKNIHMVTGGSIAGTVSLNGSTPVAGATVSATTLSGGTSIYGGTYATATTDALGHYTIVGLSAGPYSVRFDPPYQSSLVGEFYNHQAEQFTASTVSVVIGAVTANIDGTFTTAAVITGRVTDAANNPLAGVAVLARSTTDDLRQYGATTDLDGRYRIANAPADTYRVTFASVDSYFSLGAGRLNVLAEDYNNKPVGTGDPVTVAGGATVTLDAQLGAGGQLTGTVTGPNGLGVPGDSVSIHSTAAACASVTVPDDRGCWFYGATDNAGAYRVVGVPTGSYHVHFQPVSALTGEWYADAATESASASVSVTAGATTSGINAQLVFGGRVSGTVTAGGQPYTGYGTVEVRSLDGSELVASAGLNGGSYVVTAVPAGSYKLVFAGGSSPNYAAQIYPAAQQYSGGTTVTVTNGATTGGINFGLLHVGGSIEGTVMKADGTPVPYASVWLKAKPGYIDLMDGVECADVAGHYTFTNRAPGQYTVAFANSACGMGVAPDQWFDRSATEAGATTLTVADNGALTGIDGVYGTVTTPVVTSVTPNSGIPAGGAPVTIKGTGFTNAIAVRFGSTPAVSFQKVDDTTITAVSPAHALGLNNIYVLVPGATSAGGVHSWFSYVSGPTAAPTITTMSANAGPIEGGTTITMTGTGFLTTSAVRFGTTPAAKFSVLNDTTLVVTTPPKPAGLYNIWVTNNIGTSVSAPASLFSFKVITGPPPTITAMSLHSGPIAGGTVVTLTGTGFTGATAVRFGTTNAATLTVVNGTTITVTTPSRPAGLVNVFVTTQNGTNPAVQADWYTYK